MKVKNIMKRGLMGMSASLLLFAASGTAFAVAPANSVLTNTATLTYAGLATGITASVDLTVTLKETSPNIAIATPNPVVQGGAASVPTTLTTTSNGPQTFNLTGTSAGNNSAGGAQPTFTDAAGNPITSITLGATAPSVDAPIGATTLTVPADGANDGQVNGIAAGDTVVIAGVTYTVASIADNPTGSSTITLTTPLTVAAPTGTLIAEQATFNTVVSNVGSITTPGLAASLDVVVTATSATTPAIATSTVLTPIPLVSVSFTKYVRNVTNNVAPVGAPAGSSITTLAGNTYYTTAANINATSGDVLEYYLVVSVPAGGGDLTGAKITDDAPAFTTYVANSTFLNAAAAATPDVGGLSQLAAANGGLTVDSGAGAAAGTVVAGGKAEVTFQVTVQ